jgi:hypothetical protein
MPKSTIFVNPGKYAQYYHMHINLIAKAIDFSKSDHAIKPGGQFEIRLRPELFPVTAPNCKGLIILRMPWTNPDSTNADRKIAVKNDLLERILSLKKSQNSIPVSVELNPYMKIMSHEPLKVQLTQCNIFFRHANGGYIEHTGPLMKK